MGRTARSFWRRAAGTGRATALVPERERYVSRKSTAEIEPGVANAVLS